MPKNRVKKPLGPRKVCPYCNYGAGVVDGVDHREWHARVPNPKQCPSCKRYLHAGARDYIAPLEVIKPADFNKMMNLPQAGTASAALCNAFGVKIKKPNE